MATCSVCGCIRGSRYCFQWHGLTLAQCVLSMQWHSVSHRRRVCACSPCACPAAALFAGRLVATSRAMPASFACWWSVDLRPIVCLFWLHFWAHQVMLQCPPSNARHKMKPTCLSDGGLGGDREGTAGSAARYPHIYGTRLREGWGIQGCSLWLPMDSPAPGRGMACL
jgi:hypothetical protein